MTALIALESESDTWMASAPRSEKVIKVWDGVHGCGRWSSNIPKSQFLKDLSFVFLKL